MKKNEIINSISASNIYPKLSPQEVEGIVKKFKDTDQFLGESKSTIAPLSSIEINGYFLYLTKYNTGDPLKISEEEKLQIIRDHISDLKENDLISSTDEKRVHLDKSESTIKKKFETKNFRSALVKYFKSLANSSI